MSETSMGVPMADIPVGLFLESVSEFRYLLLP